MDDQPPGGGANPFGFQQGKEVVAAEEEEWGGGRKGKETADGDCESVLEEGIVITESIAWDERLNARIATETKSGE